MPSPTPNLATRWDREAILVDFPILAREVHGKRLAYLDSAATSQKPVAVMDAVRDYYEGYNANVHRGLHALAEKATVEYEDARRRVAAFIGAPGPESLVFTRGTTESINLVAQSWGRASLREGDEILLTVMEHHSNIVPWQMLAREKGLRLRYLPVAANGELDLEGLDERLTERTRLLAFTHMSNVLGTVNPVARLVAAARAVGARVLLDAAQSVPHLPLGVADLDVDFLAFSGHKMLAPTGIGGLYVRPELLEAMPPWQGGGEMISRVDLEASTYADIPHRFEAGTPNIAGAIGFGAAVDYLQKLGMERIHRREQELTSLALAILGDVPGLTLFGEAPERGGAISFTLDGVHPHDLSQWVDRDGVAIRGGHMCCQPLLRAFGHGAVSRASLAFYNVQEDLEQLQCSLLGARKFFCP